MVILMRMRHVCHRLAHSRWRPWPDRAHQACLSMAGANDTGLAMLIKLHL